MTPTKNYCENCLQDKSLFSDELFDTGYCHICEKGMVDVIDVELIKLYKSIGFSDDFIHGHLPRLRDGSNKKLTIEDIGREISRHIVSGVCTTHGCQGYESRDKWQFSV